MTAAQRHIKQTLAPFGLVPLGHCVAAPSDNVGTGTIFLIGPDEPRFWDIFSASPECHDATPDPLDRWSKRVLDSVAHNIDAAAIYPFGGQPFYPFFTWAERTGQFWSSPIGFLVHETKGLFVSFRGALVISDAIPATPSSKPCDTCTDQPCFTACPIGAFQNGYDVAACKTHLATPPGTDCMTTGCRARRACPIGQGNRLPVQAAHHMKAFL